MLSLVKPNTNTKPIVQRAPPKTASNLSIQKLPSTKLLFFGQSGSGKTYVIVELLRLGVKVLLLSSDLGGSGTETVINAALNQYPELLDENGTFSNLKEFIADSYDDVEKFITKPEEACPDIWEFNPDVIFWDGFSNFQTSLLLEKVLDLTNHKRDDAISDARKEGFQAEAADWGMVKTRTYSFLNAFGAIHNPFTKKVPIKIVTCMMEAKLKGTGNITEGSKVTETRAPKVVGDARIGLPGFFSMIIQTKVTALNGEDKGKRKYTYVTQGHEGLNSKNRGFDVPVETESFSDIWDAVTYKKKNK